VEEKGKTAKHVPILIADTLVGEVALPAVVVGLSALVMEAEKE
jgi:hypothetical protein